MVPRATDPLKPEYHSHSPLFTEPHSIKYSLPPILISMLTVPYSQRRLKEREKLGKYFAFNIYEIIELGYCKIHHPCLASKEKLKISKSLNLNPPYPYALT